MNVNYACRYVYDNLVNIRIECKRLLGKCKEKRLNKKRWDRMVHGGQHKISSKRNCVYKSQHIMMCSIFNAIKISCDYYLKCFVFISIVFLVTHKTKLLSEVKCINKILQCNGQWAQKSIRL